MDWFEGTGRGLQGTFQGTLFSRICNLLISSLFILIALKPCKMQGKTIPFQKPFPTINLFALFSIIPNAIFSILVALHMISSSYFLYIFLFWVIVTPRYMNSLCTSIPCILLISSFLLNIITLLFFWFYSRPYLYTYSFITSILLCASHSFSGNN